MRLNRSKLCCSPFVFANKKRPILGPYKYKFTGKLVAHHLPCVCVCVLASDRLLWKWVFDRVRNVNGQIYFLDARNTLPHLWPARRVYYMFLCILAAAWPAAATLFSNIFYICRADRVDGNNYKIIPRCRRMAPRIDYGASEAKGELDWVCVWQGRRVQGRARVYLCGLAMAGRNFNSVVCKLGHVRRRKMSIGHDLRELLARS